MKKDRVRSIKTFNLIYFVEKGTSDSRYKQRQKFHGKETFVFVIDCGPLLRIVFMLMCYSA